MEFFSKSYLSYFVFLYSMSVSFLYQFGFWGVFDINILEYIEIIEVFRFSLPYLVFTFIGLFLSSLFGWFVVYKMDFENTLPPGGGAHLPEAKYFRWFVRLVLIVNLLVGFYILIFFENENKISLAMMPICFFVLLSTGSFDFMKNWIPNRILRITVCCLLIVFFFTAYGRGQDNAVEIKNKNSIVFVDGVEMQKNYIGRTNESIFFWEKNSNSIEIVRSSEIKKIAFPVEKKKSYFCQYFEKSYLCRK